MIAAVVDCPQPELDKFRFRGGDPAFWLARFFPFCSFLSLPQPRVDFDFILVFNMDLYPVGPESAARELQRWLKNRDRSEPWLVAPEQQPFLVASRAFLTEHKIQLQPGIYKRLTAGKKAALLALKHPILAYHPLSEPRQIESAVIDHQIGRLSRHGVRIEDFGHFYMDGLLPVGRGTRVGSGVMLKGKTRIGSHVLLDPNCIIENSSIGDDCHILPGTVIRDSTVEKGVQLGPYCHLRNGSLVKAGAKIGNFVEMKKSLLGQGSKAMHLTYIGDARVGKKVNIGAGTITCNYDGEKKNPTTIGDNVFIGSGTELVAPVTIQSDSYVAAGSTITEDVPRHALAVARERQRNISGWVIRKRKKKG
jgi:UDP-3-O-[3-hydroxymyristoyl] glucosamine N-acyltransferase